jgi:alkylation response protein AidB-like acyl-CoA dehydrogenase
LRRHDTTWASSLHGHRAAYLDLFADAEQRDSYLPGVRDGSRIAALAISEENAGSDLRHLTVRAEQRDDGAYRLRGVKHHIVNGSRAQFFIVLAKTRDTGATRGLTGSSLLIVDADLPGLSRDSQPMLGWHSADICRVEFDDVRVPANRLIGRRDHALRYLMAGLDFERLVAGLLAVGGVAHAVGLLNTFVRAHRVGDVPLAANQATRHRVASLTAELELASQYAYHVAWMHSTGRLDTRGAAVLKVTATELAVRAAEALLQCQGAWGNRAETAAARAHRDAIAGTVAGGPSGLLRDLIFESG